MPNGNSGQGQRIRNIVPLLGSLTVIQRDDWHQAATLNDTAVQLVLVHEICELEWLVAWLFLLVIFHYLHTSVPWPYACRSANLCAKTSKAPLQCNWSVQHVFVRFCGFFRVSASSGLVGCSMRGDFGDAVTLLAAFVVGCRRSPSPQVRRSF